MHVNQSKGNKRVRKDHEERSESEDDEIEGVQRDSPDKYTVIVRFNEKSQSDMKKINTFTLTTALANKVGEIIFAKVLNDGNLLIRCENESQVEKALKMKEIGKIKVGNSGRLGVKNGGGSKGVITGVPMSVGMEEIKKSVKGGKIINAQRLKTTKEGVEKDSETVLFEFDEDNIPKKVFLGFLSYPVREFVPKPLRCFNCQRFGHIARNCKEQRRCARCGGDHEYGKCGTGVQPKCCNCEGAPKFGLWWL